MSNITLVLDDIEDELEQLYGEGYLDCAKEIALEAIAAAISKDAGANLAAEQAEERRLTAEQLTLGTEARTMKLRERNQIRRSK